LLNRIKLYYYILSISNDGKLSHPFRAIVLLVTNHRAMPCADRCRPFRAGCKDFIALKGHYISAVGVAHRNREIGLVIIITRLCSMHMDISFANIFRPFRAMDLVVLQITGLCPVQMDIALSGLDAKIL